MNTRIVIAAIAAAGLLAAGGYALYHFGMSQGMKMSSASPAANKAEGSGRKVLYWHDPMVPGQKFDKPGKSPFMDMQLVPVYADEAGDAGGGVAISPRVQQNLGIRTAEAVKGELAPVVEVVGTVAYNERDAAVVQARATGFVEKLHVRAPLDRVQKGQPLADLYVPEWVAAQEEYLGLRRMGGPGLDSLLEGAVQRMRLAGMTDAQVRLVETSGKPQPRIALVAPIDGVVAELGVREGMTVMAGAMLFRINGVATVWVNAEVPEGQAALVRPGAAVEARAAARPGRTFKGHVSAILPEVNPTTRTLKARVEVANPDGDLVPGMFATIDFAPSARRQALLVPSEAVIQTGRRTVVVLAGEGADGKPKFTPVDVETGTESGGRTEIRKGIEAGAKVVVSGQFLIDSEASLKATTTRMAEAGAPAAGAASYTADGKVESVDGHTMMLSHGPVPALKWGSMTMEFKVRHGVAAAGLKPGSEIAFDFVQTPQGEFEITAIRPRGSAK